MRVLLSIKPEFAKLIFDGTKKFEFRKTIFKNKNIKTIVVYASSPLQKVIGEFEIEDTINEDLDLLWEKTKEHAGIDRACMKAKLSKSRQLRSMRIIKA